uniref:FAD synthase n=1 Tax=Alexandrium catenella TaxID=2925 RepID=A0A7S1QS86_ALECA|mmetsp:Transcript_37869/g.102514  ORF Transcript_37869/g.102514 Transcript_37869/m.102514 type:complete len:307 (+) Transcript_37869:66-986(+)|eukprot:CAMPEP_0171206444 /NCGR_PEP_ID=MMETSP0790-20130122/27067_1 /TAXON_ID=2925 /ORGANISM="Alexandrium catenella, Strain OF101" /LENGTH=306 /DNA_ID=CAMNT_0011671991 /DNA_START=56 /DNA_END=976 /DNA_ORIENTATION=-
MVAADGLVRKSACGHGEGCAVGSLDAAALQRLASFLGEQKEAEVRRRLREELGIHDDAFAAAFLRTAAACRRGALLYSTTGELAISFNGGKDACVVLFLWLAALAAAPTRNGDTATVPQVVFFDSADEFDCVQCFVAWVVRSLDLPMITVQNRSFREGMEDLVGRGVCAMVMGQRRNDPWMAGVSAFSPSTDGWPAFMRINPIIDWSYADVWTFLLGFGLPYCKLYDEGYTSLGSINNTLPNPALLRHDGSYAPAHELRDESLERAGRMASKCGAREGKAKEPVANGTIVPLATLCPAVAAVTATP